MFKRRWFWFILLGFLSFSSTMACEDDASQDTCGNGRVEEGEECDLDAGGQTCASLGHYDTAGELVCGSDCKLDRSACGGRCGDGQVDELHGEQCDDDSMNPCSDLGYSSGSFRCMDCRIDLSGCVSDCGNGHLDTGESCDDGDDDDGDGCSSACEPEPGWTCDEGTPSTCTTSCGDGIAAGIEDCDGGDLGGVTCHNLGYHAGIPACRTDCTLDSTPCEAGGRCGDGVIQPDFEDCEGADLGGRTCFDQGYYGGQLACSDDCAFDLSSCALNGYCGDDLLQVDYEICDETLLNGEDCMTLGYYGGVLACSPDCAGYDSTSCETFGRCGDGLLQIAYETCDGADLGGETCFTLGFTWGTLACSDVCFHDMTGCGNLLEGITDIATGFWSTDDQRPHTCAARNDGTAWCWGGNRLGKLGDGTTSTRWNPVQVVGLTGVASVAVSNGHTCAHLTDGTVRCWGNNSVGQLGNGNTTNSNTPVVVTGLSGVSTLRAGAFHTCALVSGGGVRCWGFNIDGQLGDGSTTSRSSPVAVSGISGAVWLAAGYRHNCVVLSDGTALCWGSNRYGQLGDGNWSTSGQTVPVTVSGLTAATTIAGGTYHSCATRSDGTARCWGLNSEGELGDGTTNQSLVPLTVNGITQAASIAAAAHHTCVLLNNHETRCWGDNLNGELGDGTTIPSVTPVSVSGILTATYLYGSSDYTCVVLSDHTARCWGGGDYGRLGNGPQVVDYFSPLPVGVVLP